MTVATILQRQEPETELSPFREISMLKIEGNHAPNITIAVTTNIKLTISIAASIAMNVMCFLSLVAAANDLLGWVGHFVDWDELDLNTVAMYALYPLAYLMGVNEHDRWQAARVIGVKLLQNEMVAYEDLGRQLKARDSGSLPKFDNVTGLTNWVDESTELVITYSISSFSNLGSCGVVLGSILVFCPKRQTEVVGMLGRVFIAGSIVSMLNGCLASLLVGGADRIHCDSLLRNQDWSQAVVWRLFECCTRADVNVTNEDIARCCDFQWPEPYATACA